MSGIDKETGISETSGSSGNSETPELSGTSDIPGDSGKTVPAPEAAPVKKKKKKEETEEEKLRRRRRSALQGALVFLMASAAVIIMAVSTKIPVLHIYGVAMRPTLDAGDIVVCLETEKYERGDLIAFALDNKILVRRVIGLGGDKVSIDKEGVVSVNDQELEEPYILNRDLGQCNISFPYTVPEGKAFVLGDTRDMAVDSRNSAVGGVTIDEAEGKVVFRLWPANGIGPL